MQKNEWPSFRPVLGGLLAFAAATVAGLMLSRVLYEGLFPDAVGLGQPLPALLLGLMAGGGGWWLWRRLARRTTASGALLPFLPFFLALDYLPDGDVAVTESRLLFVAVLWLAALLLYRLLARSPSSRGHVFFLLLALLPVYLLTLGQTVGRADTFEFQVTIPRLGIVHPTGYPLYLLLTRLFTLLPVGSVAWRANLGTAIYGILALVLVYLLVRQLVGRQLPALFAAVALGLTPTFWSQAVEAEIYTLHALIVAGALLLMVRILSVEVDTMPLAEAEATPQEARTSWMSGRRRERLLLLLAFLLGLGLTNHLTTILLLPSAFLTFLFARYGSAPEHSDQGSAMSTPRKRWLSQRHQIRSNPQSPISNPQSLLPNPRFLVKAVIALLTPLLLYTYLPLRWTAVNEESMGARRFLEWVVGGRFQGALQLRAWLEDPTRYKVVGRLLLAEWQPAVLLLFAALGLAFLLYRRRQSAAILLLAWIGFIFYGLSYYVPDLNVFLLPAQLILAIWWGSGVAAAGRWLSEKTGANFLGALLALLAVAPFLLGAAARWEQVDRSEPDGRTRWAEGVLARPLERGAAILADSEKFPPLYYLQQAEGVRPDLEIMVLPDEAAYRAELGTRLSRGQTVYLARYLPGLEGEYYLRSAGPLLEVGTQPRETVPEGVAGTSISWGPVELAGYSLVPVAAEDADAAGLTLYWRANSDIGESLYVYTRWHGEAYQSEPIPITGQHPANNSYPTVAWEVGEVVSDYHQLPRPLVSKQQTLALEVALAPPFADPATLPWQKVTALTVEPPARVDLAYKRRDQVGSFLIEAISFPRQIRPEGELPLIVSGYGSNPEILQFALRASGPSGTMSEGEIRLETVAGEKTTIPVPALQVTTLPVTVPTGTYELFVYANTRQPTDAGSVAEARCGWFSNPQPGCVLGQVEVSGVRLPEGATNFDDKIALLEIEVPDPTLRPGGQLNATFTWQALAPLAENYTVFVQVVNGQDQIVGQVDSWPLQGTYPTSQWSTGEIVTDPYRIQLAEELGPGPYRLLSGWYLLGTQERLSVLNESGAAIDDKVVLPGLEIGG